MIYFVDEDFRAFRAWISELEMRGHEVVALWNANAAYRRLCDADPADVELVVIDVMLAVEDFEGEQFSAERTRNYLETGLRLLEDLVIANPAIFPARAVLLTNSFGTPARQAANVVAQTFGVELWQKSSFPSSADFASRVTERLSGQPA